jgi:3-hydroxyacyl-CoA dehydrogenase/enoyl-CoA hydratase/3-hydroxybutyryl-CoA epimerase
MPTRARRIPRPGEGAIGKGTLSRTKAKAAVAVSRRRRLHDLLSDATWSSKPCSRIAASRRRHRKGRSGAAGNAIFASNTSTLPITGLAENSKRPDQFIGIHFFSPVDKMMLVEVILGKKTGDKALAVALDFAAAIKKTPIVVNDTRGFYVNRCVFRYINEGL